MSLKQLTLAALAGMTFAFPALAEGIEVTGAYARAASPSAKAGGVFMTLNNTGAEDDRLVGAASDVAMKVELHTHKKTGDGVMQMVAIEGGIALPAGASHDLARGGDHVMLMGLKRSLVQGDTVTLVLTFEHAGEMTIEVPVDLTR
ncbi:copper chaperone PCu(A)C [Seohaeicola zhoushanensis]|uniref:Copper-binding protein n=1 Tax=Seohaeicola zhoushanensis TaxID=1569283 RepID=A0A8J3MAX4_9RHOB|nr:copper chaperone PCu(A)C [Seohaeicola zhoushanensis]GHF73808.1 hypothetical protein GCM10017056_50760 [Seohaeicola zhoushanensis]